MAALNLDEETENPPLFPAGFSRGFGEPAAPARTWGDVASDVWHDLEAGTYSVGRSLTGVLEMQVPKENEEVTRTLRERHADWREGLQGAEDEAVAKMTPTGRRRREAAVLPGSNKETIWGEGVGGAVEGIVHKVAGSAPSVVASVLATVLGGGVGGYVMAGSISAGDFYEQARDTIAQMPTEELVEKNPLFAGYMSMGMSEDDARDMLLEETARNKALLMGTFTAASSKFLGIEGRIAKGTANRVTGRLAGAAGEAVQEGAESAVGAGLGHYQKEEATGTPKPFDWWDLANQVAEGALVGGVMGGALGGGAGHDGGAARARDLSTDRPSDTVTVGDTDPAVAAALTPAPAVTPGVTPAPDLEDELENIPNQLQVPTGTAMPAQAGATAPTTPEPKTEPPNVTVPGATGLMPEEEVALGPAVTEEGWEEAGEEVAATPPVPVGNPVVTPEVARLIGSAGVGQPLPEQAATTPAAPEAAAPAPVSVAPEAPVTAKVEEEIPRARSTPELDALPPVPEGHVRMFHGGADPASGGGRWVTPDYAYARDYREGQPVSYVDIPEDHPGLVKAFDDTGTSQRAPYVQFEAPEEIAAQLKPVTPQVTAARRVLRPVAELATEKKSAAARGPRMSKRMKEQAAAGKEVLPAKEAKKRDRAEALARVAEAARAKIEELKYDPADLENKGAMLAYVRKLREAADPKVSLANVSTDADPAVQLLAKAQSLARAGKLATEEQLRDFMVADMAFRRGDTGFIAEYRKAQTASKGTGTGAAERASETQAEEGVPVGVSATATAGAVRDTATEAQQNKALASLARRNLLSAIPERTRLVRGLRRSRKGERVTAEAVKAADESTGKFTVVTPQVKPVVVETRKSRALKKPGQSADKPAVIRSAADMKKATAHVTQPTPKQAEAGNYPMAHLNVQGIKAAVETPAGEIREDTKNDPPRWKVKLKHAYGKLKDTVGADGEEVDVIFGPNPQSKRVWIVDQRDISKRSLTQQGPFDEHKVLVGFDSREDAAQAYRDMFSDGSGAARMMGITEFTVGQLKQITAEPMTKPVSGGAVAIKNAADIKRAAEQKTAQTEPEAAEQLSESILRDNQDVLAPEPAAEVEEESPLARITEDDFHGITDDDLVALVRLAKRAERKPEVNTTMGKLLKKHPLPAGVSAHSRMMLAQIRDRIQRLAADVPVRIVDYGTMLELWADHIERSGETSLAHGFYDPNTDTIVLREDQVDAMLVAHEGAHAVYYHAMQARPDVKAHIEQLLDDVRRHLMAEAKARGEKLIKLPYGLTNADEFLAEAFGNPDFQELLARVPASQKAANAAAGYQTKGFSVWQMLIRKLGEILWRKDPDYPRYSALEQLIRAAEQLDKEAVQARSAGPMLGRLGDGPVMAVTDTFEAATDDYNFRRIGLVAATFNTIVKQFDSLFGGTTPLKRIQQAMDAMSQTSQRIADEGRKHAEGWLKLSHKDYAEARRAASTAINLTMANMNPVDKAGFTEADLLAANPHLKNNRMSSYQARKRMMALNAEFMALKPDTRALVTSSGNWFRKTQNDLTRANIGKLLNAVNEHLTIQQMADLTRKIAHGRLAEEDADLIGDKALFKMMQHASELRVIDGIYFPLMRHGNYVVTTRDRVADMHGGKMVPGEQDVIEWRAANEKDAKKLYEKFAQDPNSPTVSSVGLVRYDPNGKIISAADAKGHPHTVGFRARVQLRGVQFFESQRQANRFIKEAKAAGTYDFVAPKFLHREDAFKSGELTSQQMRGILRTIEGRTDLKEGQKEILTNVLREASIRQMSGNRIQQRALPRRNVKGASEDVARSMVMYGQAAGSYYARVKHMDDIRAPFEEMQQFSKARSEDKDRQAREQVIEEVRKRVLSSGEEEMQTPAWVRDAYTLSYLYRLFSPAYSILNAMQPWMVTAPVLGGEYGFLRAGAALNHAYFTVGGPGMIGSGLANTGRAMKGIGQISIDTTDVIKSIRDNVSKADDGKRLLEVIDEAVARGKIEPNSGQEIAATVGAGAGRARRTLARFDRVARQLPQSVEAVNRAVTLVAAYRLHYAATNNHEQARELAFDKMMTTQGDYSVQNNPRFFNKPWLKPAVQFKKYALMMGNLLYDALSRSMPRNPSREDRWAARKTLAGIIGVQVMMAGSLGLPGLELLKAAAMVAGALGIGDGWDDWERWIRNQLDRNVGKDWGEMLATGVVGKLIDVDLSKRLSLADLAIFGEPQDYDKEGIQAYLFQTMFGAPGSMLFDWWKGAKLASEGEFLKAAETMIPVKLLSDFAKAVGGYNRRDMTAGDAVRQVAGFRSRELAEEGYRRGEQVANKKKLEARGKELSRAYINAETKGELTKIKSQIIAHNKEVEAKKGGLKQKVFPGALDRVRASNEARRRARTGREGYAAN